MRPQAHEVRVYKSVGGDWCAVCSCGASAPREGLQAAAEEAGREHVAAAELANARDAVRRGHGRRGR